MIDTKCIQFCYIIFVRLLFFSFTVDTQVEKWLIVAVRAILTELNLMQS